MKHVANRKKVVSPLPRKSFIQPKTAVKKASGISVAAKSGKQTSAKTAKAAPIVQARNAKPKAATTKKETADTKLKATVSDKKKAAVAKPAPATNKQIVKRPTEKAAPQVVRTKTEKLNLIAVVKKNQTVKSGTTKIKSEVAARLEKPQPSKTAPKISAVKSVKKVLPKQAEINKKQSAKSKTIPVKVEKTKVKKPSETNSTAKKISLTKTKITAKNTSVAVLKVAPTTVKSKKIVQKMLPVKSISAAKESIAKPHKTKSPIALLTANKTVKKSQPTIIKNLLPQKADKTKTVVSPVKGIGAKTPKIKSEKIPDTAPVKIVSSKKMKPVALPIEVVTAPIPKPKKKKVKPLGSAIFRGKKARYDFQVFPIDSEFEDAAAIFIISRRVVDKNRRAHHRMVCIGQTVSVLGELKKHRKGKCFKQHAANAISVLREENEQKRLKIEADLKSAHTIPCPHT